MSLLSSNLTVWNNLVVDSKEINVNEAPEHLLSSVPTIMIEILMRGN